jgi:ELWxxDGT repeat protein
MKQLFTLVAMLLFAFASGQTIELVKDIFPGTEGSGISQPVLYGGKMYFYADDGVHGGELWSSDGTSAGTQLVKDLNPLGNSEITELTAVNGNLVFSAANANGYELWVSDGTDAGTFMVLDINPGSASSVPTEFTVIGNQAFFQADDGINGPELWATDGTTAGTHLVKNINATEGSYPSQLIAYNGKLIFRAYTNETGDELWTSDGTEAGTVLLMDIFPGGDGYPRLFHEFNGLLYFRADDDNGDELWVTDGTTAGTHLLKDINPETADGSSINEFTEANGQLFFRARTANEGFELWKTDGTEAGTVLVKDIWVGGDSFPGALTAYNGKVYFQATDGSAANTELWVSDGTEAGTYMLKDINPTTYSAPNEFIVYNNMLYFVADDGTNGSEFWVTDGTPQGTQKILSDVAGVSPMYYIPFYVVYGNNLYFKAEYGSTGAELQKFTPSNLSVPAVSPHGFAVYPNPTAGILNIRAFSGSPVKEISVFSLTGQKVLGASGNLVDVSELSSGLYLLKIKAEDQSETSIKIQKI